MKVFLGMREECGLEERTLVAERVWVEDDPSRHGLHFTPQMAQELGISEKSPDYRNPFKTDHSEVRQQHHQLAPWASPSLSHSSRQQAGEGNV